MLKNRRVSFDYEIMESYEAGIMLTGSEVKSLREGNANLAEAFARIRQGEVWLEGMHIAPYEQASYNNHEPLRSRKLLLNRREIAEMQKGIERKGLTLVPSKLYFKDGWAKITVVLGRGKKKHDKRQADAQRDAKRQIEQSLKYR